MLNIIEVAFVISSLRNRRELSTRPRSILLMRCCIAVGCAKKRESLAYPWIGCTWAYTYPSGIDGDLSKNVVDLSTTHILEAYLQDRVRISKQIH